MKLNANMTKTMIVSRSRTIIPSTPLTLDGTVLKESTDLAILRVTFDAKIWPLRNVFALFPELQLTGLISLGSPGKYFMINRAF